MGFTLQKGIEKAEDRFTQKGFKLRKNNRGEGLTARVWAAMDGSGSTQSLWLGGTMQQAIQLVLPTAVLVDDDGQLPVAVFNEGANHTILDQTMTVQNHEGFVERNIVERNGTTKVGLFGGTDYSPVLTSILKKEGIISTGWFGGPKFVSDQTAVPVLIEFFTDGDCCKEDERKTSELLAGLEKNRCRAYVLFIGVGHAGFGFIRKLADDRGNVGFASIADLSGAVNDERVMEYLLPDELLGWLKG